MKDTLWKVIGVIAILALVVRAQSIDTMPPVVVKTVPEAGVSDVTPGEMELKVTFSKEMTDKSWSWSTAWKDSTPVFVDQPKYDDAKKTCSVKVKLEPNKTYGFWLNSNNFQNFQDSQGHTAVPYLLVFQTKAAVGAAAAVNVQPQIHSRFWMAEVPKDFVPDAENMRMENLAKDPAVRVLLAPQIVLNDGEEGELTVGADPSKPSTQPADSASFRVTAHRDAKRIRYHLVAAKTLSSAMNANGQTAVKTSVESLDLHGDTIPGVVSFYPTSTERDGRKVIVAVRFDPIE